MRVRKQILVTFQIFKIIIPFKLFKFQWIRYQESNRMSFKQVSFLFVFFKLPLKISSIQYHKILYCG